MTPDFVARLQFGMTGAKTGVTGVAGVTDDICYVSNPLMLQQLRLLRQDGDASPTGVASGVTSHVTRPADFSGEAKTDFGRALENDNSHVIERNNKALQSDIDERAALARDCVPTPYLDTWARIQCQRPAIVDETAWHMGLNDAGLFFDAWASLAVFFGWTAGELFDVPGDGRPGGLVWFLRGQRVAAFGPEHARLADGRIFDRKAWGIETREGKQ